MKTTIKRSLLLALPVLLATVMLVSPALAGGSVVHDAAGDSTSPYTDVVMAKITEQKKILSFKMDLAGPVPAAPSEAVQLWVFHVDTDPANAPGGLYNEYIVRVRWDNGVFDAHLVNRINFPVVTAKPIEFSVDGATVKAWVPLALLSTPTSFRWNAATRPNPNVPYTDFAPDGGVALITWTQ